MKRRCGLPMACAVILMTSQMGLCAGVKWNQNGHWYEVVVVEEPISWPDAQAAAIAQGGYLATLTSEAENLFVFDLVCDTPGAWRHIAEWAQGPWLGGSDVESEGNWQWVTGEPWDYTHWLSGQPDNWFNEDYLCFWGYWSDTTPPTTPTWNDATAPQTSIYSYVIEYDEYIFGILQPINADGSSVFKLKSTVPVKFQLFDVDGKPFATAVAKIYVQYLVTGAPGPVTEAVSTATATIGNLFRYDPVGEQYIFNLATKGLAAGKWLIIVNLCSGQSYNVEIGLR
jgi:hypothetical protein